MSFVRFVWKVGPPAAIWLSRGCLWLSFGPTHLILRSHLGYRCESAALLNHSVAAADDAEAMRIGGAHLARLIGFGVGVSSAEANQNPLFLTAANIQREKVVVPHRGQLLGMDDGGPQHAGGGALERARGSLHGARDAGAGEAGAGTSGAGTSGGVVVLGGTRAALGAASEPTGKAQVTAHAATAEERREGELHAPLRLEGRPELEPMAVDGTPHTIQQIHECHHVRRQVHQEHAQEPRHQASTGPDTAGPPLELAGSERVVVDADVGQNPLVQPGNKRHLLCLRV